jgi:hypothetical protein
LEESPKDKIAKKKTKPTKTKEDKF